ncbi:unnamed protein product [Choristocarpus tenellus]
MDFGCGTGCLTMLLKNDIDGIVIGVDTSQAMLEQFEKKVAGVGGSNGGTKVITRAVEVGKWKTDRGAFDAEMERRGGSG